ncbi:hypothetical protein PFISCL1PPCAC_14939 [Pristionchus fissidentatus]|uniref:BTB domain-containing protein n=1 Tax=Pristionchus fissidentatus TaxID=1538716 RepID=A0AAV5VY66_9BILA|nr:hypothetical protein PFISCL1PPCAC_14939 [Pristionchus fissidentatus]
MERFDLNVHLESFEAILDAVYPCKKPINCCGWCGDNLLIRLKVALELVFPSLIVELTREIEKNSSNRIPLLKLITENEKYFETFTRFTTSTFENFVQGEESIWSEEDYDILKKLHLQFSENRIDNRPCQLPELDWPDSRLLYVGNTAVLVSASLLSLHSPFFSHFFYSPLTPSSLQFDFPHCSIGAMSTFIPSLCGVFPKQNHDANYEEFIMEQGKMKEIDRSIDLPAAVLSLIQLYNRRSMLTENGIALFTRFLTRLEVNRMVNWLNDESDEMKRKRKARGEVKKTERKKKKAEDETESWESYNRAYMEKKGHMCMEFEWEDMSSGEESNDEKQKRIMGEFEEETNREFGRRISSIHSSIVSEKEKMVDVKIVSWDGCSFSLCVPLSSIVRDIEEKSAKEMKKPIGSFVLVDSTKIQMESRRFLKDYDIDGSICIELEVTINGETCLSRFNQMEEE